MWYALQWVRAGWSLCFGKRVWRGVELRGPRYIHRNVGGRIWGSGESIRVPLPARAINTHRIADSTTRWWVFGAECMGTSIDRNMIGVELRYERMEGTAN